MLRLQHGAFGTKVLAERDRFHSERTKAKAKYDESCSELESARAKKVSAEADGKHVDRATKAWKEAEDTMESAKVRHASGCYSAALRLITLHIRTHISAPLPSRIAPTRTSTKPRCRLCTT